MPKYSNQRQRIMALYRILYEETDEQHGLTMDELLSRLEDRGIVAECRSIYDDIKALNSTFKENPKDKYAFTISILKTHTRPVRYYLKSRELSPDELKLLVNIVRASPYASKRNTKQLLKKLERLGCEHQWRELRASNYISYDKDDYAELKDLKAIQCSINDHYSGGSVFQKMEIIQKAIKENRCISFKYYGYVLSTKTDNGDNIKLRHKGVRHNWISPFEIVNVNGEFHLIAVSYSNDPQKRRIASYNIKKITEIEIHTFDRQGSDVFKAFSDAERGSSGRFILNNQGKSVRATLICNNEILNDVIDRFGEAVAIKEFDEDHFKIEPYVQINPSFIGWVLGFGNKIKITSPEELVRHLKIQLENARKQYSARGRKKSPAAKGK